MITFLIVKLLKSKKAAASRSIWMTSKEVNEWRKKIHCMYNQKQRLSI